MKIKAIVLINIVFLLPLVALANAGSPLLWGSFFHLFIGNMIIGFIEAYFIKKIFETNINILLVILGNYISMFIGLYILVPIFTKRLGYDFFGNNTSIKDYSHEGFVVGMFIAFIVSVISEFPFFYFSQKKETRRGITKTLKYTFSAQVISYIIITTYYFCLI